MPLKIEVRQFAKTRSLILAGVLDYSTTRDFENSTRQLEGFNKLVIDFKEIRFIDSTGIYSLAQAVTRYQEKGIAVEVQNISKPIYEILDILGLVSTFGSKVFIQS